MTRLKQALIALYAVVAVTSAVYLLVDGVPKQVIPALQEFNGDCLVDWWGAAAWSERWDIYSDAGLKRAHIPNLGHPPTTPFWFIPLKNIDPRIVHGIVGQMVFLMLIVELFLLATDLGAPAVPATVALVFAWVLSQSWMRYHLAMVQISEPVALLFVLSWWFLRRGRQIAGGAMMGLALTLKLFPGLMMVFFLLTRRWKAFVAGSAVWLAIAALMTWGYGGLACWGEYFAKQPGVNAFWAANVKNGGLPGVVLRLYQHSCRPHFGNLPSATIISTVVALMLLVLAWRLSRNLAKQDQTIDGPFALFSTVAIFVNPVIWEHYFVLLIFPWAVAAAMTVAALRDGMPAWKGAASAAALLFCVWITGFDIELKAHPNMAAPGWHTRVHEYEIANWLMWPILIALLGALLFRQDRRARSRKLIS